MEATEDHRTGEGAALAAPWDVPQWAVAIGGKLATLSIVIGGIATYFLCYLALHEWSREFSFFAILLAPVFGFLAVVAHEFGHVAGAIWARMTPMRMQVGNLDLLKRRRGWRMRWHRNKLRVSGFVIAFPHPDEPLRRSFVKMIIGGPLANMLLATIFIGAAQFPMPTGLAYLGFAFAGMNLAVAVATLLPSQRDMASDGMQLMQWMRGKPDDGPGMAFVGLMGISVNGMTADELPDAEVAVLARQAMPMPLMFEWIRLKASQNLEEWHVGEAVERSLDEHLSSLDDRMLPHLSEFLVLIRAEIAFSKAMAELDASHLTHLPNGDAGLTWNAPHLAPRFQALGAALAGNADERKEFLQRSKKLAEQSVDLALHRSEAKLRASIEALRL